MRAADSSTWERVRQLAAQDEPAPFSGAGAGPARPLGPAACERCADAAGPGNRPRAGAPFVRADGDCGQLGRCAPGRESGAAAGLGAAGAGRAGALRAGIGKPLVLKFSRCAKPGASGGVQGETRGTWSLLFSVGAWISGLHGFPAEPPSRPSPEGCKGRSRLRLQERCGPRDAWRPSSGRDPALGET